MLYGTGLRLSECLQLRVKDLDFASAHIVVRSGKGGKDRVTPLPEGVKAPLTRHLEHVRQVHGRDLARGFGRVVLPEARVRKYPAAPVEWGWQFVFPAARLCRDPRWGPPSRYHLHESVVQRAVAAAVRRARITKRASAHSMRHKGTPRIPGQAERTATPCRRSEGVRGSGYGAHDPFSATEAPPGRAGRTRDGALGEPDR